MSGGMRGNHGGWVFKIDYDVAIVQDSKFIARLTHLIENRWFKPATMISFYITLIDLALMDVKVAAQLGLSLEDLSDIACVMLRSSTQAQLDGSIVELPPEMPGAYKRGGVIADRLSAIWEADLPNEETSRALLKKAKADLARHKRNKAKYDTRAQ